MKRALVAALTGVGLVGVLGLVGTGFAGGSVSSAASQYGGPGHAGGPAQDLLYGGGRFGPGCSSGPNVFCIGAPREFSVDAHANPVGRGAYGTLTQGNAANGNLMLRGDVTCLAVDENRAVVGGLIRESVNPATVGGIFFVYYEDRGRAGSFTRDGASLTFLILPGTTDPDLPSGFPNECTPVDNNAFDSGYIELGAGEVVIHDE